MTNSPEQKAAQPEACPNLTCSSPWKHLKRGYCIVHPHPWHDALPVEPPVGPDNSWLAKAPLSPTPVPVEPQSAKVVEGFEANIVCHTVDAQQRMRDPENVRFKIGMVLDALGLQEEVDYTLEVRRTYESK